MPSSATNASRVSQLLGRATGEIEYIIATERLLQSWTAVTRIREHVQQECARLIVSDLRTWMSLGVDQTVWKALYYCVIEALRSADQEAHQPALHAIIDDGVEFFLGLLRSVQTAYNLPVEKLSWLTFDPAKMIRQRYCSVVMALSQRLLLCLGDLARYQHQLGRLPNCSQANSFYVQAQRMNPKNGRPFNQLAILALYAHKRLDCVYFYTRALMASNPFHTAKESLLSLFHESSKKYAARSPLPGQSQAAEPATERRSDRHTDLRTETWVHPGRGERLLRTLTAEDDDEDEHPELRQTSDADLMKAFTTTYLHVQGKLYTRISLESYQEDACVMLRQFSELLSREPMPLKMADMLHILGINMFNIANTKLKDERLGSDLRSTYQELALAVAIEMAGHVIQRANQLLTLQAKQGQAADRLFPLYSLETCIVFIKVWTDWLLCSGSIWNPPPCTNDYRVRAVGDCWASLAELTNQLHALDVKTIALEPAGAPGDTVVRLPEDLFLQAFSPLICANYQVVYADTTACSLELARDLLRLRRITFVTQEYLCGTEPAALRLLKAADGSCRYISQVASHTAPEPAAQPEATSEPDVLVEWSEPVAPAARPPDEPAPQKLALERRALRQEEHSRRVQAIVSSASASVVMEVRPRFLVADTNCFVDYLDELRRLVSTHSAYTLTVPVTVSPEFAIISTDNTARDALAFVRQRGQPQVRCVTSRGHLLSSAMFTAEQDCDEATNDDRILSCCLNLERGVRHVTREVVLLTDDRNLRLKALSFDVPTRTVPDFLAWAS
ncbi:telomerase-binding protein EST1A-like [Pollicipes pollicipes]|uniref:telomerase-binding protein EST1A-like n=1 Tax=Pollicipes pollicipes TaxID=41117 RepID=UPI00188582FB|nr:telomerase-binding protein EST1A-like [Pollicipes pollicipes]